MGVYIYIKKTAHIRHFCGVRSDSDVTVFPTDAICHLLSGLNHSESHLLMHVYDCCCSDSDFDSVTSLIIRKKTSTESP